MFFIGICGASCSGKSTLAKLLSERLGERCIHLRQDNYYIDQSPLPFEERCKVNYDGKDYLVMKPLRADVALIGAYKVDKAGNVWYKGSAQNFNRVMATAADLVIVEAEELVEVGEIEPENVMTPGILVNYIVVREGK